MVRSPSGSLKRLCGRAVRLKAKRRRDTPYQGSKDRFQLRIHPLFWGLGIVCVITGKLTAYLLCTLTALLHECGHIFYANHLGYTCQAIRLMPYGGCAVMQLDGISARQELFLSLAGVFVNCSICVICGGLWWFFPQTYAFTDTIFYANVGMLAINLLPAYPLDGGRVLACLGEWLFGKKFAYFTPRLFTIVCTVALAVLGGIYHQPSLAVLSVFLLSSLWEEVPSTSFTPFSLVQDRQTGVEVKYVIISPQTTISQALRHADKRKYLILQCYRDDLLEEVTQDELLQKLQTHSLTDRVF